jgi:hypothetical protein
MGTNEPKPQWSLATRLLFRFVFVYLIVYNIDLPFSLFSEIGGLVGEELPLLSRIGKGYQDGWDAVITWVGSHLFGIEIAIIRPNGSGDTTWHYMQAFCDFVFALIVSLGWSILDRKRASYALLLGGLRIFVRYYLAATMVIYGSVKVIKGQFPDPSLDRLIQPFGDASPMGLLWTFMGASQSYNIFSGAGELLGALLLTTRRTTLLGSLVCIGVLSHVAMLNFSYDVPVKLFSLHLLFMAIFLATPDLRRLADLFLFNRPVAPAAIRPLYRWKWLNVTAVIVRTVFVVAYLGLWLVIAQRARMEYGDLAPKSPLYGIWNVEAMTVDGSDQPPLITNTERWRRVVFESSRMMAIQLMSDSHQRYGLKLDEDKKTLELTNFLEPEWKAVFTYERSEPDSLVLEGTLEGKKLHANCRRTDASEFRLVSRGFHWINEYPFNR